MGCGACEAMRSLNSCPRVDRLNNPHPRGGTSMQCIVRLLGSVSRLLLLGSLLWPVLPSAASAQEPTAGYPSKPIHIINPFPAGGTLDTVVRLIAKQMAENLGKAVVV